MRTRKQFIAAFAVLCLAAISSAQDQAAQNRAAAAPQAGSTTLTPQERQAAIKQFETTRDGFLKSIAGLSEKQWTFKPAPDRWSVAEVSEHITISEITLFGLVQKTMQSPAAPEKRDQVKGKDEMILQRVPDRSHKAQAPEFLKPTGRWPSEADLVKAFEQARAANIDYIRTTNDDLRDHFYDHPVFGTLDDYQWLLLISAHSARHTEQIEEVKADPNFPKE
jgi:DinB superfamily